MGTVLGGSAGSIIGVLVGAGLGITTGVISRFLLSGEEPKGEGLLLVPDLIEEMKEDTEKVKQSLDEVERTVKKALETTNIAPGADKEKVDPSQE